MSPQFAADVSLLLSATADPVVPDLLDANKLVRDMRRSSAQSLHFHSFNENSVATAGFCFVGRCERSSRPDGSRTGGYVITLSTEELYWTWSRRRCQCGCPGDPSNFRGNCWIKQW